MRITPPTKLLIEMLQEAEDRENAKDGKKKGLVNKKKVVSRKFIINENKDEEPQTTQPNMKIKKHHCLHLQILMMYK